MTDCRITSEQVREFNRECCDSSELLFWAADQMDADEQRMKELEARLYIVTMEATEDCKHMIELEQALERQARDLAALGGKLGRRETSMVELEASLRQLPRHSALEITEDVEGWVKNIDNNYYLDVTDVESLLARSAAGEKEK